MQTFKQAHTDQSLATSLVVSCGNNTDELAKRIAKQILDIDTLEIQGRDCLDFHDVGVNALKRALVTAFYAGQMSMTIVRDKSKDSVKF